jgi:phosphoglycerol transferase
MDAHHGRSMTAFHPSPRAEVGIACVAAAAAVAIAVWACGGLDILAGRPLKFEGDAILHAVVATIAVDDEWTWHGSRFGAPGGFPLAAFGLQLPVETALMKLVSFFTDDPVTVLNGTWLTLIGITAIDAYAAFRLLGLGRMASLVCGALFAASPHAFLRNVTHLNLHAAFVPVPTALAVLVASGGVAGLGQRTFLAAGIATAVAALGYVYYPFFYAILFVAALLVAFIRCRRDSLRRGAVCLTVVLMAGAVNLAPTVIAWARDGRPASLDYKQPGEADTFGLRIRDLVMPSSASRIPLLAALGRRVEAVAWPLRGESRHAKLGLAATIGLLVALAALVGWRPPMDERGRVALNAAGCLIIALLIVAVPGGLGSIFNTFVTPQFRCYNRVVPLVSFLCLAALGTWLSASLARMPRRAAVAVWFGVLACGLFEQDVAASIRSRAAETSLERRGLGEFVAEVEETLPDGGSVWMLPVTAFPVDAGSGTMREFDHAKPILFSKRLRWSWPSFGSTQERLSAEIGDGTTTASIERGSDAGYDAVWLDGAGDASVVTAAANAVVAAGGRLVRESADGRYRVYALAKGPTDRRSQEAGR